MKEDAFMACLDAASRAILLCVARRGHAHVSELALAAGLVSHSAVLLRIRRVINRQARLRFGRPVLRFRLVGEDPETGERVCGHWWLDPGLGGGLRGAGAQVEVREGPEALVLAVRLPARPELNGRADVLVLPRAAVVRLGRQGPADCCKEARE